MKKGNFTGKTSDMDWHVVELRRALEREMKRFQTAKMTDKYEEVLQAKLDELASAPRPPDTNSIHIHHLECEDFNRLHKFHQAVLELCSRPDQYERYETILREMLLKSRVKSPTSNGAIKPFCVICGSNLSCFVTCNRAQQIQVMPVYEILNEAGAGRCTDMNMAEEAVGEAIPFTCAAAAPEGSELTGRQQHQATTGGQPSGEPRNQPRGTTSEQVGRNMEEEHPRLSDFQCQFTPSYTSHRRTALNPKIQDTERSGLSADTLTASTSSPKTPAPQVTGSDSQQENSTTSQPLTQQVPSNTNASTQQDLPQQQQSNHTQRQQKPQEPQPGPGGIVCKEERPSDDSDSDSDRSKSRSDDKSLLGKISSGIKSGYQFFSGVLKPNGGSLRSSAPLSDRMHQSQDKLVIGESKHTPTSAKRARDTELEAGHSLGTAPISTNETKPEPATELQKPTASARGAVLAGTASTQEERNRLRMAVARKRRKRSHPTEIFRSI